MFAASVKPGKNLTLMPKIFKTHTPLLVLAKDESDAAGRNLSVQLGGVFLQQS
jgi:hypothetical protein